MLVVLLVTIKPHQRPLSKATTSPLVILITSTASCKCVTHMYTGTSHAVLTRLLQVREHGLNKGSRLKHQIWEEIFGLVVLLFLVPASAPRLV